MKLALNFRVADRKARLSSVTQHAMWLCGSALNTRKSLAYDENNDLEKGWVWVWGRATSGGEGGWRWGREEWRGRVRQLSWLVASVPCWLPSEQGGVCVSPHDRHSVRQAWPPSLGFGRWIVQVPFSYDLSFFVQFRKKKCFICCTEVKEIWMI